MRLLNRLLGSPTAIARAAAIALVTGCGFAGAAIAQSAALDAERVRISSERAAALARFARQEAECQRRFFVSDCAATAKAARRELLDDLRRQEVRVNDMERRNSSADAIARVAEKNSTASALQRAEKEAAGRAASDERLARELSKAESTGKSADKRPVGDSKRMPNANANGTPEVMMDARSNANSVEVAMAAPKSASPPSAALSLGRLPQVPAAQASGKSAAQVQSERSAREVEKRARAAAREREFESRRAKLLERNQKDGGKRSAPLPLPSQ